MLVFLFTDIEGSSKLWEEHTGAMTGVIARHDQILREQVEGNGGRITKHTGDGITAVFDGGQPLACVLESQLRFAAEPWGEIGELRIRAGLHAGEAEFHLSAGTADGDYFGPPVNATARVMSAAWGGQVLLTPEVSRVSTLPPGASLLDLGEHLLKSVSAPQQLYQLDHPQLPWHQFPPPRTLSGQSIRQAVGEDGKQMATLEPQAIGIALLVATLLPALQGELDPESGALEGNLGVLEDLGALSLRGFVAGFAERLRSGKPLPAPELQTLLQRDLQTQWQAGDEAALAFRADASRLLQAVHGVEAVMTAASDEVKEALARGLADLGSQFGEFRWMLAGVRDTLAEMRTRQALQLALQREQLDLQRQQLVKTNLILHRQQLGPQRAELTVSGEVDEEAAADVACPYKGLAAFEADDAEYFYGREELVAELTARLAGTRFLAVVGPSGSGKSSLVRAGLLPAVWAGALPGSQEWQTLVLTPGAHPLEELAVRVSLLKGIEPSALHEALRDRPQALHLAVKQALADASASGNEPDGVKLLLVVDQFEEIFALCRNATERRAFIDALLYAVDAEDGRAVVVPTVRADFYGRCADYPALATRMGDGLLVGPMSEAELRAAIEQPAAVVGLRLETGLADTILDDVAGEPGALPLMSHALLETFERRRGARLTLAGYAASGGVVGAIAQTADTVYDQFSPGEQEIARHIFLRLTELGEEGAQDTRRRVSPSELVRTEAEAPAVEAVLKALADARLITTGEDTVEVAHEALIREWPLLRGWLEDDREGLRAHRHLTESAGEWERLGREEGELYRGARLAAAGEWQASHSETLNPLEREFLAASQELAEREEAERDAQRQRELEAARALAAEQEKRADAERRRAQESAQAAGRLRRRALLLAGAMGIAVILAVVAFFAFRQADQNASAAQVASTQAVSERNAAETAQAQESDQRATAVAEGWARATSQVLAEEEARARATQQAVAEEQRALAEAEEQKALEQASIGLASQALVEIEGNYPERAIPLALEALEEYPYTWQAERALGQAVLEHRLRLVLAGHTGQIYAVAWSPDGTRIGTASTDGTAIVWDGKTGERLATLLGHERVLYNLSWSPSGEIIATTSSDGTARIWDAATGEELFTLSGHKDRVYAVAWSPSGDRVATTSFDATTKVWDPATGQELLTLSGHNEVPVADVAWSPSGTRLAAADAVGEVIVWDAETGGELFSLDGHEACVNTVRWSPSGDRIATASDDRTSRVWDASTGEEQHVLTGHADAVWQARWSPAGDRLVTTSLDATTRVWDPATGEAVFAFDPGDAAHLYADVDWSPSGGQVATIRSDLGSVTVLDVETGIQVLTLAGHTGKVMELDWSPTGPFIVSVSEDNTARVWDVSPRTQVLTGHTDIVFAVDWSPSGDRLASAGLDGTARVWDVATGEELLALTGPGEMGGVLWSPSGDRLVTDPWFADPTVVVWDVSPSSPTYGQKLFDMESHHGGIGRSWSPVDDRFILTGFDGTARIWDATTGEALPSFEGHGGEAVTGADWSADGKRIVTSCGDGDALVWDSTTGEILLTLDVEAEESWMTRAAWSPDGKRIATHSDDTTGGRVWDASNGELLLTYTGHTASVFGLDWSLAGDRLLTVSNDGTAKIWDAATGAELLSYSFGPQLTGGKWSPDMKQIALSANDGRVRIVDVHWHTTDELIAYARECCLIRELTADERELFGLPPR